MNPRHHAVVVGISRYTSFPTLHCPASDADLFLEWLLNDAQVPRTNVHLIPAKIETNLDGAAKLRVTREQVYTALAAARDSSDKWTPEERRSSRLYFFASGHGIGGGKGLSALLASNADPKEMANVGYEMVHDWFFDSGRFGELVFFADCCRTPAKGAVVLPPAWSGDPITGMSVNSVIGFAAGQGAAAREPPPDPAGARQNGYFTKALVEGLRQEVNGRITSVTVAEYVKKKMQEIVPKLRPEELPVFPGADTGSPIVFKDTPTGSTTKTVRLTLHPPAAYTGELWLELPDLTPMRVKVGANGLVEVDVVPGNYGVLGNGKGPLPTLAQVPFAVRGPLDVRL